MTGTGIGEGAGATAKILGVLKDLPLWLLVGLAGSAGLVLFVPAISAATPPGARSWVVLAGVVFAGLGGARAVALVVNWWPSWRASVAASRRFHLTPFPQQSFWSCAKQSDDSLVTQISVRLLVKNLSGRSLALVKARLLKPSINGEILDDEVSVRDVESNMYRTAAGSGHSIPPEMALPASVSLLIRGVPWRNLGGHVRATIGIVDDEGHEQRIKLTLRVLASTEPMATMLADEMISSISDRVEREVASVLQAELSRYDKCNRSVGGLGSLHLVIEGRELRGVGGDWWNPNSPKNQSISDNPDSAEVRSDNLKALMAFYERQSDAKERTQFAKALLDRIDKDKGYLRITYFIVYALSRIGNLSAALEKAKAELPQGESKAFGLSNTLMMLNGLLRYRYLDFTPEMLDDIEKFVHGLQEHSFQIPEKIAEIRAQRLLG